MHRHLTAMTASRLDARSFRVLLLVTSTLLPVLAAPRSFAQLTRVAESSATERGAIEGALVNADTGRAVEGVKVTVRETGDSVVTDRNGFYSLENLAPGTYSLSVGGEGFQGMRITDVVVQPGHTVTLSRQEVPVLGKGEPLVLDKFIVSAKDEGVVRLDQFDVTDAKEKPFSVNVDIPRTIDDVQPYYIFDAKTIDQSGTVNVEDFLKQRLTMNATALTNSQTTGDSSLEYFGNTSSINLRGLGTDKTLILVNGRRMPGVVIASNGNTTEYQPDINGIPMSAIDRIEVLPSSASGIYGGSAIGGVVNIVLRRNYSGGQVTARYQNTWDTDAPKRSIGFSWGRSFENGKSNLMITASVSDAKPLLFGDRRQLIDAGMRRILATNPSFFNTSTSPFSGALVNIAASPASVTTLTLKTGQVLGSRNTFVPAGTSPSTSASVLYAGLIANAGQWNLDLPYTTQGPTGLLRPLGGTPKVRSIGANLRRKMWPSLEAFVDFSYNKNDSTSVVNPYGTSITIKAANPINPFTTDISIRIPDATAVPVTSSSENSSLSGGFIWNLPRGWVGNLDYTHSKNSYSYKRFYSEPTFASNLASGLINPFVDTLMYPLGYSNYLYTSSFTGSSTLDDVALRGSGSLWELPTGAPRLTVGLERRIGTKPETSFTRDVPSSITSSYIVKSFARKQVIDSLYAESEILLVKEHCVPFLDTLALQLSGRIDRYRVDSGTPIVLIGYKKDPVTYTYGTPNLNGQPFFARTSYQSKNYTLGIKYQPIPDLILRASVATAFVPPTPDQLVKNPLPGTRLTTIDDTKTGGRYGVETIGGGNPDLTPQHSRSINAGVIWQPQEALLRGLRLDLEYYKIEQFDVIDSLSAQAIVDSESLFPDRVTRDSNGMITLVDTSLTNLFHRVTEGFDLGADYHIKTDFGTFTLHASQSVVLHLKNQYLLDQPEYDLVGFPSEGGAVKYKSNGTFTWETPHWLVGWTATWYGSYKQYGAIGGSVADQNGGVADSRYINTQGGDTIPYQIYHDIIASYTFWSKDGPGVRCAWRRMLAGLSIQLGVKNVFNKPGPFDVYYDNNYYISPYADASLRTYWINVKKSF